MLASIKKSVFYLSGVCVLLVVVEECYQRIQTSNIRLQAASLSGFRSITHTQVHSPSMSHQTTQDSSSPNVNYDVNKEMDVTREEEQVNFTHTLRHSAARLRLSRHRNDSIITSTTRRGAGEGDSSNRGETADISGHDLQTQLGEEEERRLKQSPFIYLEGRPDHTRSRSTVSESVKLVSYFRPLDSATYLPKSFHVCQHKCRFVRNMSLADAVLFQASKIRDNVIPNFYRPPGQRWVFFTSDPAVKNYDLERSDVKSQFNWTITYQLDSDFPTLFARLQRRKPPVKNYEALFERKNKQAAWFVSHCPTQSKREVYVDRMRSILQVDIFGKCGNLTCGPIHYRRNDSKECLPMLTQHYKHPVDVLKSPPLGKNLQSGYSEEVNLTAVHELCNTDDDPNVTIVNSECICSFDHISNNPTGQVSPSQRQTRPNRFYFAFENSFCKDYVSEKFFKLYGDVDVIPVVRGGFDYKRYLPSGIFVDASDFKTPEALALYLLQLGNDKHKYLAMLKRKNQWLQVSSMPLHCLACQALHTSTNTSQHHPNLKAKFNGVPSNCWLPTDLD